MYQFYDVATLRLKIRRTWYKKDQISGNDMKNKKDREDEKGKKDIKSY